jgi:ribonuclease P protein subunit RPR2
MGKTKSSGSKQPHLVARLSHLYRVSNALSGSEAQTTPPTTNLSRFYLTHLRSVAKKSVLRLGPSIKRTICKRCDTLLVPGVSCEHRVENKSKNGRKKWADVLIVECKSCGSVKRFPVGMDGWKVKNQAGNAGNDRKGGNKTKAQSLKNGGTAETAEGEAEMKESVSTESRAVAT